MVRSSVLHILFSPFQSNSDIWKFVDTHCDKFPTVFFGLVVRSVSWSQEKWWCDGNALVDLSNDPLIFHENDVFQPLPPSLQNISFLRIDNYIVACCRSPILLVGRSSGPSWFAPSCEILRFSSSSRPCFLFLSHNFCNPSFPPIIEIPIEVQFSFCHFQSLLGLFHALQPLWAEATKRKMKLLFRFKRGFFFCQFIVGRICRCHTFYFHFYHVYQSFLVYSIIFIFVFFLFSFILFFLLFFLLLVFFFFFIFLIASA